MMNNQIKTINIAGGDVRMVEQDNTVYLAGVDFVKIIGTCKTYFANQCNRLKIAPTFKVGVTGYTLLSDVIRVFEHLYTSKLTVMHNRDVFANILNDLKAIHQPADPVVKSAELELTKEMIDYAIDLKISPRDCKRYWDSSIKKQIERHDHPPFSYFKIAIEQIAVNRAKIDVARLITDQTTLIPEVEELKATMEPKVIEMPKQDFSFNFVGVESELNGMNQVLIDSRELHTQLQVKTKYTDWIERRATKSGFKENVDYKVVTNLSVPKSGSSKARIQEIKQVLVTQEMAEHLAQMESTDIGFAVRDYFRKCRNTLQEVVNSQSQVGDHSTSQTIPTQHVPNANFFDVVKSVKSLVHTFKEVSKINLETGCSKLEANLGANEFFKKQFGYEPLKEFGTNVERAKQIAKHSGVKHLDSQNNPTQNGLF